MCRILIEIFDQIGETEWSKTGQHTSTTEVELTSHGITQARDLSRFVFENQCQSNLYPTRYSYNIIISTFLIILLIFGQVSLTQKISLKSLFHHVQEPNKLLDLLIFLIKIKFTHLPNLI